MRKSLVLLTLCALTFSPLITSCKGSDSSSKLPDLPEEEFAQINLEFNKEGGSASYLDIDYKVGQKIKITVDPNKGYFVAKLTVNDKEISSKTNVYLYQIESKIVNINVVFKKIAINTDDFVFEYNHAEKTAKIKKYAPDSVRVPYPFIVPETVKVRNELYKIDGLLKDSLNVSGIEKIVLSKEIKTIDKETFASAYGLKSIEVVDDNPYFASKDNILYSKDFKTLYSVPTEYEGLTINVPDSVETIGDNAFMNVRLTQNVVLPNSVKNIGEYSFFSMRSLENIVLSNKITTIPKRSFSECTYLREVIFHEGIESIGESAFEHCPNLINVSLPRSLRIIGNRAFYECNHLLDVTLNEGLIEIGPRAFGQCQGFIEITMPSTLKKIGEVAFEGCQYLKKVNLNEGLEYLGGAVFYRNPALLDITIPASVTTIEYNPFMGTGNAKLLLAEGNKNYAMKDGILYNNTFTKLICVPYSFTNDEKKFRIPDSVTELGYNAFSFNILLEHVIIPKTVTKMNCSFANVLPIVVGGQNIYNLSIYYEGTIEEFSLIDHGDYPWDYEAFFKGNVLHCKDADKPLNV